MSFVYTQVDRIMKIQLQLLVIFLWLAMSTSGVNSSYGVYKYCDGLDKHCIECLQLEMDWGKHLPVPNQNYFKHLMQYTVNEYRSKYAKKINLGNMRYAEWNNKFYEICDVLSSSAGDSKFYCLTGGISSKIPTRFDHDLVDFTTTVDIKINKNSTNIFEEQFNILISKILVEVHVTEYNMDEFGCEYSFQQQNESTAFLLRCIFYTNPDYAAEGEISSNVQCLNCTATESCSSEFTGLCTKNVDVKKYLNTNLT